MTPPLDCKAALRQLWEFLDEELDEARMHDMRQHLECCQRCWPHYDFERAFLEAVARTGSEHAAPEAVRRQVLEALREAGYVPGREAR